MFNAYQFNNPKAEHPGFQRTELKMLHIFKRDASGFNKCRRITLHLRKKKLPVISTAGWRYSGISQWR